jgi:hypothetical protein
MRVTTRTVGGGSAVSVLKTPIPSEGNADERVHAQVFHKAVLRRAKRVDN